MYREYSWKKSQIEKNKNKKKGYYALQQVRKEQTFDDGDPYYTETSALICRENKWTGFYMRGTSVMKELMLCYLHVFIEIYSLIMTK